MGFNSASKGNLIKPGDTFSVPLPTSESSVLDLQWKSEDDTDLDFSLIFRPDGGEESTLVPAEKNHTKECKLDIEGPGSCVLQWSHCHYSAFFGGSACKLAYTAKLQSKSEIEEEEKQQAFAAEEERRKQAAIEEAERRRHAAEERELRRVEREEKAMKLRADAEQSEVCLKATQESIARQKAMIAELREQLDRAEEELSGNLAMETALGLEIAATREALNALASEQKCDDEEAVADTEAVNDISREAETATETSKPKVLFVLGGPGAGKGTQCAKIIESFPAWAHVSAGDCLRAERSDPSSADGELINKYIKEGQIVPVAITVKLLQKAMAAHAENGKTCFLIDGFPRNLDNVTGWSQSVGDAASVCGVLFYEAEEEELEKRLLSRSDGRDDDQVEVIKRRFKTYVAETMPIVDMYREKGQVISIDGMKSIEEVWEVTKQKISEVQAT